MLDNVLAIMLIWAWQHKDLCAGVAWTALSFYGMAVIAGSPLMREEHYGRHAK